MASIITKMEVSIAAQVRAKLDALAFAPFADPPGFYNPKGLRKEIAVFLSSFPSNSWGGKHGFLLLGLGEDKMRIVVGDSLLNCDVLKKPKLINPDITDETKGRDLQRLQEKQLGKWSDYLYQRVLYQVGGEIIVAVVPEQYIKPIYTQYVGYNSLMILQFFAQLQKWFVISNGDKLKMR